MKNILSILIIIFNLFILVNCSSTTSLSSSAGKVPDWYLNHPDDANYFFALTTAESQDMQLAVDKATIDARAEIARQVDIKLMGLQKKFDEVVGVSNNSTLLQMTTQATKTVVSITLTGSKITKKDVFKEGELYRAYVLVQYPIGAASEALAQQIKNREELYTRYRATQAFKDLEDEVKKYEEWKANQGK